MENGDNYFHAKVQQGKSLISPESYTHNLSNGNLWAILSEYLCMSINVSSTILLKSMSFVFSTLTQDSQNNKALSDNHLHYQPKK